MKFCKDCKHYMGRTDAGAAYDRCDAASTKGNQYLIRGEPPSPAYCETMRDNDEKCGKEAKLFSEIPKVAT